MSHNNPPPYHPPPFRRRAPPFHRGRYHPRGRPRKFFHAPAEPHYPPPGDRGGYYPPPHPPNIPHEQERRIPQAPNHPPPPLQRHPPPREYHDHPPPPNYPPTYHPYPPSHPPPRSRKPYYPPPSHTSRPPPNPYHRGRPVPQPPSHPPPNFEGYRSETLPLPNAIRENIGNVMNEIPMKSHEMSNIGNITNVPLKNKINIPPLSVTLPNVQKMPVSETQGYISPVRRIIPNAGGGFVGSTRGIHSPVTKSPIPVPVKHYSKVFLNNLDPATIDFNSRYQYAQREYNYGIKNFQKKYEEYADLKMQVLLKEEELKGTQRMLDGLQKLKNSIDNFE